MLATFPGWHEELDENGVVQIVKSLPSRSFLIYGCWCSDDQRYERRYMSSALPAEVQIVLSIMSSKVSLHHASSSTPTCTPNVQRSDLAFNTQLPSLPTFPPGHPQRQPPKHRLKSLSLQSVLQRAIYCLEPLLQMLLSHQMTRLLYRHFSYVFRFSVCT